MYFQIRMAACANRRLAGSALRLLGAEAEVPQEFKAVQ